MNGTTITLPVCTSCPDRNNPSCPNIAKEGFMVFHPESCQGRNVLSAWETNPASCTKGGSHNWIGSSNNKVCLKCHLVTRYFYVYEGNWSSFLSKEPELLDSLDCPEGQKHEMRYFKGLSVCLRCHTLFGKMSSHRIPDKRWLKFCEQEGIQG